MGNKSNIVVSNLLWRLAERCGAQGVSLIVSIVLARILAPDDYGVVALISVFIALLSIFVDSGLGNSLIQKKNADDLDFSTVFYFNIVWCGIIYIGLVVLSPIIAQFYESPELTPLIRIAGLNILISGLRNVQQAYVSRNMIFRKFFFATLGGTLLSAFIGIYMAYAGAGAWALVIQVLSNSFINMVILWFTVKWRPVRAFSFERLKRLFSYGWKLFVSALLNSMFINLRTLIIGKMYSSADLAYYNKGQNWPDLIVTNINSSIDSVLFPAMSRYQDEKEYLVEMTRRSIRVSTYIMAPMMIGLAAIATPLVRIVLTEKWLFCVPYMRIFCFTYILYPINTANLNAIKALGRSDLFLKLEIGKKLADLSVLLITMQYGVLAMAYGLIVNSVISQIINSWPNKKLLGYGYFSQLKDIFDNAFMAIIMGGCVLAVGMLPIPDANLIVLQILVGGSVYLLLSFLTRNDLFFYFLEAAKPFIVKNSNRKCNIGQSK